ncbi:MAG TPA: DNA-directed RNA polymerase subunit F [Methanothermococcus okinawensis]|uniref:DNA-directed RNA polymerase subunit Rpo4 n=1 Tax=Methanofervidicoccus abyssi TaxID=2082189 RepID=A0A401HPC4_9EURY|nr:RNA polymerase Rpb4 family protein [Methanofervidicoccus abyssi]GBF36080.1 DNA-directed RNA polymerase subunit F [Methanofervidicoccus abyssi]HIP16636.1 DNA-directed RNA polymerase subunit F [Methanothermococcus okinawensis]HIP34883.1 DNA-directed RNA polymerase subunit F [Methanothermococcus okinawensis]
MIGKKLISERYVTIAWSKEMVNNNRENYEEIPYELNCALSYLEKFAKLSVEEAEELLSELKSLGLDEKTSVKIVDLLPKDEEDLKVIFYKSDLPENAEEILNTVRKYIK